ncbi:MAG: tetratricopeptide repeat protein [Desulfobacteraceae bacterium]|nr:tetratricopeptide repeat protein [Desulfobacteraceae bacterium]
MVNESTHKEEFFSIHRDALICMFLAIATLTVYWQVTNSQFVYIDDGLYVTNNTRVQGGLSLENIIWAFTTGHACFWHPLTWLSHMMDCQFFGMSPGWHHVTNLLLHIANILLLFLVFRKMTGALWRSAFVAALFALHPFHVESVAWVSERKDLLSTFFWFLTMWSYIRYVERPGIKTYLPVLLFFTLGLMAKPMLVTLPFVLLLLDYWPLGRFQFGEYGGLFSGSQERWLTFRLIWEKIPLFIVAAGASIAAYVAQQTCGSIGSLGQYPLFLRIANALVSYGTYIVKMIWPHDLSVFYPYLGKISTWQAVGAGLFLICASIMVVRMVRRHPYLTVGWLWYLGTLVPVSGLIQVGSHSMADRYTYVPLIGLFILISWGVPELAARWRRGRIVLCALAGVFLSVFMSITWVQVGYWTNSIALFEHAIDVTPYNSLAHYNLGNLLARGGKFDEAIRHYHEALGIRPDHAKAHNNLGLVLAKQGKITQASKHYFKALRIDPSFASPHFNLGNLSAAQGKFDEAIAHYFEALRLRPDSAEVHNSLAAILYRRGRMEEAVRHYSEVLRIQTGYSAHYNLGYALLSAGRLNEAIAHFVESLRMKPDNPMAHNNMGNALARLGNVAEAVSHYREALRIKPGFVDAHINMGIVLKRQGKFDEAVSHFREVLRTQPDNEKARRNLEQSLQLRDKSTKASNTGVRP